MQTNYKEQLDKTNRQAMLTSVAFALSVTATFATLCAYFDGLLASYTASIISGVVCAFLFILGCHISTKRDKLEYAWVCDDTKPTDN